MRRGRTCSGRSNPGAVPILRPVANEVAPGNSDARAIKLEDASFAAGSLRTTSYARPGKLFTASRDLMVVQVGRLKREPFRQIINSVVTLLGAGGSQQVGQSEEGE